MIFINKKWEPPFDLDAYVNEWILGLGPDGEPESEEEIEVIQGPDE